MRWDRFFEDLEDQLAAEREAERAALDSEAERVRVSRLPLRQRLVSFALGDEATLSVELADGSLLDAAVGAVGADWIALRPAASSRGDRVVLAPIGSIRSIVCAQPDLVRSARPPVGEESRMAQRVTLGFALRDLARRRVPVSIVTVGPRTLTGTIDRVGADHLDLAEHERGTQRRGSEVTGCRIVALSAIAWVAVDAASAPHLS